MTSLVPEDRARLTAGLVHALPDQMRVWLPGQRWFGGKTRTIRRVNVDDLVWLPAEQGSHAIAVLTAEYDASAAGTAAAQQYVLLLGVGETGEADPVVARPSQSLASVAETSANRTAVHALLRGLADGTELPGVRGGRLRFADATPDVRGILGAGLAGCPTVRPVGQEQSNSSVRLGTTHVFKLFRRLEFGDHPQIEVGRYLARVGFRDTSPLEGSITYVSAHGAQAALASVERWVDNVGDGWRYVTEQLQAGSTATSAGLIDALDQLGATTAAFHDALAAPTPAAAFAPEPVTADDTERWRADVLAQASRTLRLIEIPSADWPEAAAAFARRIGSAREAIVERVDAVLAHPRLDFDKIRIHGDYHLGQTLKTPTGFAIIDFEGEPTRPLEERRRKHSALRDVAGMLRSIDYAEAAAGGMTGGRSALQQAFLAGYRRRAPSGTARFVPAQADAFDRWVALFELEKVLYEIDYEANNRPAWLHLPLGALCRQLAVGA